LESTTNLAYSSGICLSLISKVVGNEIIDYITQFISNNINSNEWYKKEACILALVSIVECPPILKMKKLIHNMMPYLLKFINNETTKLIVKDTSIYCIAKICKYQPKRMINIFLKQIIKIFVCSMQGNCFIAEKSCWGILNIIETIESEGRERNEILDLFVPICQNLLKVISRQDIWKSNLVLNSYVCLNKLISITTKDYCQLIETKLLIIISEKLKYEIKNGNEVIQGLLCETLKEITKKLGIKIIKYSDNLMKIYFNILSNKNIKTFRDEVIYAISAMARALGSKFIKYMNIFFNFLLDGLRNVEEDDVLVASIFSVVDISDALKTDFLKYLDVIMEILITHLLLPNIYEDTKILIISCFGELTLNLGQGIEKYSKKILKILSDTLNVKNNDNNPEKIEYVNLLRENVTECFTNILQGVKGYNKNIFKPFVNLLMKLIHIICVDKNSNDKCLAQSCFAIGDLLNVYGSSIKESISSEYYVKELIDRCSNSSDSECQKSATWTISQFKQINNL
jgi:importin subunit beta-1